MKKKNDEEMIEEAYASIYEKKKPLNEDIDDF